MLFARMQLEQQQTLIRALIDLITDHAGGFPHCNSTRKQYTFFRSSNSRQESSWLLEGGIQCHDVARLCRRIKRRQVTGMGRAATSCPHNYSIGWHLRPSLLPLSVHYQSSKLYTSLTALNIDMAPAPDFSYKL